MGAAVNHFVDDPSCTVDACGQDYPTECPWCGGLIHASLGEEVPVFNGLTAIFVLILECSTCYYREEKR